MILNRNVANTADVVLGIDDVPALDEQVVLWLGKRDASEEQQSEKSHKVQRTACGVVSAVQRSEQPLRVFRNKRFHD